MSRGLSIFLILNLLVSQSIMAVPHSHEGTSTVEPRDHHLRPHFHLHWHQQTCRLEEKIPHDHLHDALSGGLSFTSDIDHDSSAFEVDPTSASYREVRNQLLNGTLMFSQIDSTEDLILSELGENRLLGDTLDMSRPKCALFLRTLSIRC
ncbi:hypothetical protein KOR42_53680 [Thalassoglobus neptunius]|uniref:Uncharacterized protein n=1 Tax=Thalassoglobus neptunius TaxID=1938619 RepID=A0A5C5V8P5_9PLAN|nr:hypothetical protein [Thalassoglobus neptunius]TWT34964.1 hypothetical protein KOR42_53680 [Thalassoglobus neptunius]